MKTKTDLVLLLILVLLAVLSSACTPDEIAQIQAAMDTAVIFTDGNVFYGYAQAFNRVLAVSINYDGTGMTMRQVSGEFALEKVKMLAELGWTRIAWASVPEVIKEAFWVRIIPMPTFFVVPETTIDDMMKRNTEIL